MAVAFTFKAKVGQTVKANLVRQAEVLLIDDENFERRRSGVDYKAVGGYFTMSPAMIQVPRTGIWHLVIENHDQAEATASLLSAAA